jgi:peptidoglycan/LPS O-acetylase OafA/YrhL
MVFAWHFTHAAEGYPVSFEYVPSLFMFSLLDEGHTGVALFMTLSGYLFAKLLDGKTINYQAFLWNRALRLLPLLTVVTGTMGIGMLIKGESLDSYLYNISRGLLFPTLPNGGWSITVEFHYYLSLPLVLWLLRKSKLLPLLIVLAAIVLRILIYREQGEVQTLAYWTIIGRIDQFALGMLLFQFRAYFTRRHALGIGVLVAFALFYWFFDHQGGFYRSPSYPSPNLLWVFLPTIEGLAYGIGITWYDSSFSPRSTGISRLIGRLGTYSYSIYLLHFAVVFSAARFVNQQIMDISNFYLACLWSVICFLLMLPVGHLSFRYIEAPFLKFRKRYIISDESDGNGSDGDGSDPAK